MTDEPRDHMNEEAIARRVRELPAVEPDPAFRDRLRSAFVTGEIAGGAEDAEPDAPAPRRPARAGGSLWRWLVPAVAGAAAAAALVLAIVNPGPPLRLLETAGEGYVRIDGSVITLADRGGIDDHLAPGATLSVPVGSMLDVVADGVVMYEITGGTRMTVPDTPGRWFNREVACSLMAGEIRVKTGPSYPGSTLRVYTPDGMVVVTGTLLSVQCDAGGTCVCVLEGTAHVGVDEADLEPVPPGQRKVMLKDGTVEIIPVKAMHRDGVLDFDQRVGHEMEP